MIKVLIVEDEMLTRVGIESLLKWEEHGYTVVGVAENGKKALGMIRRLKPDIVITDILMPVMNGIQLMTAVKNEALDASFIIISAYDEYKYVREAMKLGAVDYLLKLDIEAKSLLSVLSKAAAVIPKTQKSQEASSRDKSDFLRRLIAPEAFSGNQDSIQEFDFGRNGVFLVVCADSDLPSRFDAVYPNPQTIKRTLDDLLSSFGETVSCILRNRFFVHLLSSESLAGQKDTQVIFSDIKARIIEYFVGTYGIVLETVVSGPFGREAFPSAYHEAVSSLAAARCRDAEASEDLRETRPGAAETIDLSSTDAIRSFFDSFIQRLPAIQEPTQERLQCAVFSFVRVIDEFMRKNSFLSITWHLEDEISRISKASRSIDELIGYLYVLRQRFLESHQIADASNQLIIKAKAYLDANYGNTRMVLTDVAFHCNVSSNYLCRVFKGCMKMSPMQYLSFVRVGQAKRLLKSSDKQVKEISQIVGYQNPFYFDRIFKKMTGMTPLEYRKM